MRGQFLSWGFGEGWRGWLPRSGSEFYQRVVRPGYDGSLRIRGKALKLVRKREGCRKWRNYSSIACLG